MNKIFDSLTFPSPVQHLDSIPPMVTHTDLWVKREDLILKGFGGNKTRKILALFHELQLKGLNKALVYGPECSNWVVTACVMGRLLGIKIKAVCFHLSSLPRESRQWRATCTQALEAETGSLWTFVPRCLRAVFQGFVPLPMGGTNYQTVESTSKALLELPNQMDKPPDVIVVPVGTSGTIAGILKGVYKLGWKTMVIGVRVASRLFANQERIKSLTQVPRRFFHNGSFYLEHQYLGKGYGIPTAESQQAQAVANHWNLVLDATYTAKAFACFLDLARSKIHQADRILFWHTYGDIMIPEVE